MCTNYITHYLANNYYWRFYKLLVTVSKMKNGTGSCVTIISLNIQSSWSTHEHGGMGDF